MREEQKNVIQNLRDGDPAAFRVLYQGTWKMLYQYALYKLNGNTEAAEDVVADAYVDALEHAANLTFNHNVNAWLYRIVHAKVVDYVRRQARRGEWIRRTGPLVEAGRESDGPEDATMKEEDKRFIRAAFYLLDDRSRDLLWQKYFEGKCVKDIALGSGKTEKAIESLIYRAKKDFSDILTRLGGERIYLTEAKEGAWESLFQIIF
jgi:RNA polymerase sigma-70 factor, ECF subfamily